MATKKIIKFKDNEYGLFFSTELEENAISINKKTGDILLNEGGEEDCYYGAFISPKDLIDMSFLEGRIIIKFGKIEHTIGITEEKEKAEEWIKKCNSIIKPIKERLCQADVVKIKFESPEGEFSLKKIHKVYGSIVALSQYCASSLEVQQPYFKKGTTKSENYLDACTVKAAKVASYEIQIKYPVYMSPNESFGREVTKRILESIRIAQDPPSKEKLPEWMNSNILEAIARILDGGKIDFGSSVEWSKDFEEEQQLSSDPVEVPGENYEKLIELAKVLKIAKIKNISITGDVLELSARLPFDRSFPGKRIIVIKGYDEKNHKRTARVPVSTEQYKLASIANLDYEQNKGTKIVARGDVEKIGFYWFFNNLRSFEIIER